MIRPYNREVAGGGSQGAGVEAEAIPYEPSRLRGERLLVLAPHPDDEVIACGGLVAQHIREGRSVRVVVATDGAAAGDAATREEESRRALVILSAGDREGSVAHGSFGTSAPQDDSRITFLRHRDRELPSDIDLHDILIEFKPDLILVPSPVEIHPDHSALSNAFCDLIQRDESLFADLAVARVAFYEVGQPLRPNTIVDITDVADAKYEAIAAHESQLAFRDYIAYARGLNAYRAMTMPPEVKFAEAYYVIALPELRTTSIAALRHAVGDARSIASVVDEAIPISVIVRTKDRPALLREAIESIRGTRYPCEIVVVNDGGDSPSINGVKLIEHETSRGRSEAMNSGVRAASNAFIAFLDDDDLYHADHLATLARAANGSNARAWYTNAVSAFVHVGEDGGFATESRLRFFDEDFDRDLLLAENYIPLPTLLVRREDFLDAGGFDRDFDLFEDWEFLIRLSRRGDFIHVPRVTVDIRHIDTAGSITMTTPEGSPQFRAAKKKVWAKHAALVTHDVFANALERQKKRINSLQSDIVEQRGLGHHFHGDIARLEREKRQLIDDVQSLHNQATQHAMRIAQLEGVDLALRQSQAENEHKAVQIAGLKQESDELRAAFTETQTTVQALYAEIRRQQEMLDMIYASRTWKLHTLVEKVKGRG
jgi:LmbE family N-acetylglucosaminyl deacetylase